MSLIGTFIQDGLVAGDHKIVTLEGAFGQSQTLKRGTVLGQITSGGDLVAVDSALSNGAEDPYAVLAEDVTTGVGETAKACIYLSGQFAENKLVFGGSDDADTHRTACRDLSIYFTKTVAGANGIS